MSNYQDYNVFCTRTGSEQYQNWVWTVPGLGLNSTGTGPEQWTVPGLGLDSEQYNTSENNDVLML